MLSLTFIAVLVLPASLVLAGHDIPGDIKDEIEHWNLMSRCIGEEMMMKFTLAHYKVGWSDF